MANNFSIERLRFAPGEEVGAIEAKTYFLSMADDGGMFIEWSADGFPVRTRSRVVPGDLWVMPPGHTFWTRRESDKTCIQVSLCAEWLEQIFPSAFALLPQVRLQDRLLTQMMRTLAVTTENLPQNPTTALYQESLVTTLVLHLATHYGQTTNKQNSAAPLSAARVQAISRYIRERLPEKIALTDLAQFTGLSASQFSLRFRETTGQTPHQFVTSLRVDRARELLVTGRYTPADVAAMTGFADQSHLTRHVRRVLGVTPGALKRG